MPKQNKNLESLRIGSRRPSRTVANTPQQKKKCSSEQTAKSGATISPSTHSDPPSKTPMPVAHTSWKPVSQERRNRVKTRHSTPSRIWWLRMGIRICTFSSFPLPFPFWSRSSPLRDQDWPRSLPLNSDILKIDIEYAEFDALTAFDKHTSSDPEYPIGQMLIEIHLFKRGKTLVEFITWWEALEARGWRPAWTEPNLLAVTLGLEDKNPRLAEVCFFLFCFFRALLCYLLCLFCTNIGILLLGIWIWVELG